MSIRDDISKLRRELLMKEALREKTEEERARDKKTAAALDGIPVKKMMDQALYLRNELLPAIEKKKNKTHPDYEFFNGVMESLVYAIILADRYDTLERRNINLRIWKQLQQDNLELMERELSKYQTLEELCLTESLDRYADGVKARVTDLLKGK
jgi:hypothetical protein